MIDKDTCALSKRTIYVEYQGWSECLTYYIVGKNIEAHPAIIFVGGDMRINQRTARSDMFQAFAEHISSAVYAFREEQIPIIILGRPGLYGSTGDHEYRHRVTEYGLIGRAIEELARHFKLSRVALVGHSGGSSSIMGALSLGTKEGNCIVAGSGGYEIAKMAKRKYEDEGGSVTSQQEREWHEKIFSHHRFMSGISKQVLRRIFLVGDPDDALAPFSQQVRYAEALKKDGLYIRLVEAKSTRSDGHTFVYETLIAAGRCLRGEDDDRVVQVFRGN